MEAETTTHGFLDPAMDKPQSNNALSLQQSLHSDCFNCSICLDSAAEPVVTLCGHLYCGPCIYQWMLLNRLETPPWCPVCKSPLSEACLVPLYGCGVSRKAELWRIHRYGAGDNDGLRLHYGYMSEPVFYSTGGGSDRGDRCVGSAVGVQERSHGSGGLRCCAVWCYGSRGRPEDEGDAVGEGSGEVLAPAMALHLPLCDIVPPTLLRWNL